MNLVAEYIHSLKDANLVKDASYDEKTGEGFVASDKVTYMFSHKEKGFIVSSIEGAREFFCPRVPQTLIRVLASRLFGVQDGEFNGKTYQSVVFLPVQSSEDSVTFQTKEGKQFVCSSSNTLVTLGLYDILYSRNGDQSVLMLPKLFPSSNPVAVASSKLPDLFVSIKNSCLSNKLDTMDDVEVVPAGDVPQKILANKIIFDHSKVGSDVPEMHRILQNADRIFLKNSTSGFDLLVDYAADSDFGLKYSMASNLKATVSQSQQLCSAENRAYSELVDGIEITSSRDLLEEIFNSVESRLDETLTSKFMVQSHKFLANSKEFLESGNLWKVPVSAKEINSFCWG